MSSKQERGKIRTKLLSRRRRHQSNNITTQLQQKSKETRFFQELIDGLVHGFPVCCVAEYCSDILNKPTTAQQAKERGIVFFRTFSIYRSENLFNGLDRIWKADHFVPCLNCQKRYERYGRLSRF